MDQDLIHLNSNSKNKLLRIFLLSFPIFLFFLIIAVLFTKYEAYKLPIQQQDTVLGNKTEEVINK